MHPLPLITLVPDSLRLSRDAARRHAVLTTLAEREAAHHREVHAPSPSSRKGVSTWFSFLRSPSSASSA